MSNGSFGAVSEILADALNIADDAGVRRPRRKHLEPKADLGRGPTRPVVRWADGATGGRGA